MSYHRFVLDYGHIRLMDYMADDLSVVNAARVSFNRDDDVLDEKGAGLIGFLMKNHHGTPFEHNAFRFSVKCPIFVAREWQRHRIGSFNEWSSRYSELLPEFYVPEAADVREQVGKPGAYTYAVMHPSAAARFQADLRWANDAAWNTYQTSLEAGVAKELARLVLPVNIYTRYYWTVNARSLMNFLALRNAPTAMLEIRRYAEVAEKFFADIMPLTHAAFVAGGRVAP